jgi:hypothetical protein
MVRARSLTSPVAVRRVRARWLLIKGTARRSSGVHHVRAVRSWGCVNTQGDSSAQAPGRKGKCACPARARCPALRGTPSAHVTPQGDKARLGGHPAEDLWPVVRKSGWPAADGLWHHTPSDDAWAGGRLAVAHEVSVVRVHSGPIGGGKGRAIMRCCRGSAVRLMSSSRMAQTPKILARFASDRPVVPRSRGGQYWGRGDRGPSAGPGSQPDCHPE